MPLGDAHVETARRHGLHQQIHRAARRHGGRDAHDAAVAFGKFDERLAENVLIARRRTRRRNPLARIGIEPPRRMPDGLVVFGGQVALALYGHDVQQLGSLYVAQRAKRPHQLLEVVAVHGSEIAEIETFEQIALVEQPLLDGVARLLAETQQARRMRKDAPQPLLEAVVVDRSRNLEQVVFQRARGLIDRHVVVVQNHQQVGALAGPGVVQPFEGQPAGHRTVADDRHDPILLAPQFGRLGHAEGRRDRHRGVSPAESVVFALGHAREAADAPQPALGFERFAAARDDLVGIGLVSHVPHDLIGGRVEDIMQGGGQLHSPQTRREVSGIYRTFVDDIASQLVAVSAQLLRGEPFEVLRRIDM